MIKGWRFYSNAMIPTCAPHEEPDLTPIADKSIWKTGKKVLFVRYTTDFDCDNTNWWYVIKDTPFDIAKIKAKRRYEINKGIKNFDVKRVKAVDYVEKIYDIQQQSFLAYPPQYRPVSIRENFIEQFKLCDQDGSIILGAFNRESGELCGYCVLNEGERDVNFAVLKAVPEYEKLGINAALVNAVLCFYNEELLAGKKYICDGSRNIVHKTAFQDYLEKYFEFRKAYCKLVIEYNPKYKWIFKVCYVFRKIFYLLDKSKIFHKVNSILKMEEIVREQRKNEKK